MIKKLILFLVATSILSCKKEATKEDYAPKFVIEGEIEQDGYAKVSITHNLPFAARIDSAQVEEIIIRYAKVTVSDGRDEEVLTGRYDRTTFPYFFYKGSSLKGKAGVGYELKVEYAGFTMTAATQIPERVNLDSLWFEARGGKDRQLCLRFKDPAEEKNYYKIYSKLEQQTSFSRTLLSNQDDKFFNGKTMEIKINRGAYNNLTQEYDPYFVTGDKVQLKFSSIPKSGYDFWQGFQNEILNSSNPLMGSTDALRSNIKGQAVGIWCGYGSSIYAITAD